MKRIYKVCVPKTHRDCFDYLADGVEPCIGARVIVPFRKQQRLGVVVMQEESDNPYPGIKPITNVIDDYPLFTGELLALCFWVSAYYQSPLSEVIPLAMPKKFREGKPCSLLTTECYQLAMDVQEALLLLPNKARRQRDLVDFLAGKPQPMPKKTISQAGFGKTHLDALLSQGVLAVYSMPEKPSRPEVAATAPLTLNAEQGIAVDTISAHLHEYRSFLLQGVTGSGKTEVYLQVIAKVLAAGRQVLVLVPEIGLTPQLLLRFQSRFQEPMAVIHSNLNDTERQRAWQWAKEEVVKLVIGTRAAIFTPMPGLGLIVIDEEHDASLKQLDGVRYSARDTALMRANLRHIPIVLGSATPSLETLHNCALKKYMLLRLNQKALKSTPLHYEIIDIRNQALQEGLASRSCAMIKSHLERQNQVLVFINRRGFAPVLLCHQCGWMADCKACDAHLTLHQSIGKLMCHHCGFTGEIVRQCRRCQGKELLPVGVGTQRVYDYLTTQFPNTSIIRIDRDEVRKKQSLDTSLERISSGDAQLIVGTQMLAKGHHFPRLTLVVVLDADNGFYNQDFRALERLGQLLTQVAGRAGRAHFPGEVAIQTYVPQHPLLNLLIQQGYDDFARELLLLRQHAEFPPYHFLTVVRAQGKTQAAVVQFLSEVKAQLDLYEMKVLGPAPAPLARKAGYYRMQLLVKSSSRHSLKTSLTKVRDWLTVSKTTGSIRWSMDVDPIDLS